MPINDSPDHGARTLVRLSAITRSGLKSALDSVLLFLVCDIFVREVFL